MGGLLQKTVSRNVARRVRARPRLRVVDGPSFEEVEGIKYGNLDLKANPHMIEMLYNFPKKEMNHHLVQVKRAKLKKHNRRKRTTVRHVIEQKRGQKKKHLAA